VKKTNYSATKNLYVKVCINLSSLLWLVHENVYSALP